MPILKSCSYPPQPLFCEPRTFIFLWFIFIIIPEGFFFMSALAHHFGKVSRRNEMQRPFPLFCLLPLTRCVGIRFPLKKKKRGAASGEPHNSSGGYKRIFQGTYGYVQCSSRRLGVTCLKKTSLAPYRRDGEATDRFPVMVITALLSLFSSNKKTHYPVIILSGT